MKLSRYKSDVITKAFILLSLVIEFYFFVDGVPSTTLIYMCELMVIYIYTLYKAINKQGLMSLYTLSMLMLFLFCLSKPFLTTLDLSCEYKYDWSAVDEGHRFPEVICQQAILYFAFFIESLSLFVELVSPKKVSTYKNELKYDQHRRDIGVFIMKLFLVFALIRAYKEAMAVVGNRGLLFTEGSAEALGLPIYLRIASVAFSTGYLIFLSSNPQKDDFKKIFILNFLVMIPGLLIGNRMEVGATLLFYLWFLIVRYHVKINVSKLLVIAISIMVGFQILAYTRVGDTVEDSMGVISLLRVFLDSQSSSYQVLFYYLEYAHTIHLPYPAALDSMISGLIGATGQSEDVLALRSSLGHQVTYAVNPDYYLAGFSTGSSYVAELVEYGFLEILAGALFMAWLMNFFNKYMLRNRYVLMFAPMLFYNIVSCARGSLVPSVYIIFRSLLMYYLFYYFFSLIIKNRKKHEKDTIRLQ